MHSTKPPNFSNPYIPKHEIMDFFSSHTHKVQHHHINLSYQTLYQHTTRHSNKIIMQEVRFSSLTFENRLKL